MNYLSMATAERRVKCSEKECEHLQKLLQAATDRNCFHGFSVKHLDGGAYLYAEESCEPSELPDDFLEAFGKLIKRHGMKYLEVGIALYAERPHPDSCGGTRFRIYPNGDVFYPKVVWPDEGDE